MSEINFFLEHSEEHWAIVLYGLLWLCLVVLLWWLGMVVFEIWESCYAMYRMGLSLPFLPGAVLGLMAIASTGRALAMLAHSSVSRVWWWINDKKRSMDCLAEHSDRMKRLASLQDRTSNDAC